MLFLMMIGLSTIYCEGEHIFLHVRKL